MTDKEVNADDGQRKIRPLSEETTHSADEFNRLYQQYKRAGYELIAMIYQQQKKPYQKP